MLKNVVDKHPVIMLGMVFFAGMSFCMGTIIILSDFFNQDIVPNGTYILIKDVTKEYVTIEEYNRIKEQFQILHTLEQKEQVRELYALKLGFQGLKESLVAILDMKCAEGNTCNYISRSGIKLYNSLGNRFNKIYSGQHLFLFPEDTFLHSVTHPRPLEVMSQVELALALLDGEPGS